MTDRLTARRFETSQSMAWHTLPQAEVEQILRTGPNGLQGVEADRSRTQCGPNRLAPPKRRGLVVRLLMQFHNILLYVMLAAAVITPFLGYWVDTGVLLAAVVPLAIAAGIPLRLAYTHSPAMQAIFGSTDLLSMLEWGKVIGAGPLVFCVAELEKLMLRRTCLAARLGLHELAVAT